MKILITGAKGQLGKKLIEVLEKKHQLILTDSENMDVTDIDAIRNVVKKEMQSLQSLLGNSVGLLLFPSRQMGDLLKQYYIYLSPVYLKDFPLEY